MFGVTCIYATDTITKGACAVRTPANPVVVEVLASFGTKHLDDHAVEVQALHQHPGKRTQEEEVQENSHHLTGQLGQGTRVQRSNYDVSRPRHECTSSLQSQFVRPVCVDVCVCVHVCVCEAYCARLKASADEQQDLSQQDGTGQVGMDVVALVPDGAD